MRFILCLLSLVVACGDDDGTINPDASFDAGTDVGPADTGPIDAGADTNDAGTDAPMDAGADTSDAGASVPTLFAVIGNDLVAINPTTAEATTVGAIGAISDTLTRMRWDAMNETLYAVYDVATGTPKLATLDVCTGAATAVADLTLPSGMTIGGIDFDDAGQAYVSISADAGSSEEMLATLDTSTGVVTTGVAFSMAIDADIILLGSPSLAIDQDPPSDSHIFYDFDLGTGAISNMRSGSPRVAHQAFHEGTMYGLDVTSDPAPLVTIDVASAVATDVGGSFDVATFRAMATGMSCP